MFFSKGKVLSGLIVLWGGLGAAFAYGTAPSDLKLNDTVWTYYSSGIRNHNFIDVYQCDFYYSSRDKPEKDRLFASINNLNYPMVIRIKILTSMLPDKMPEVWRDTLESEVTGKAFKRFRKGFAKLDEGDILIFMYLPGEGTGFYLNNKLLFQDPDPGLIKGLLEQWIGPQPISEDMKRTLTRKTN